MSRTGKWDDRYIALAHVVASWSEDSSRNVGAVIVGKDNGIRALGYNAVPRHLQPYPKRVSREGGEKYLWIEHAERNAIYAAARSGVKIGECTMYTTWFPCIECARAIIQSGIIRVFVKSSKNHEDEEKYNFSRSCEMFSECGIEITEY